MAERDPSNHGERTDGTLLGVPAPRVDETPESALRKPVFVRAGTSPAESETDPPPLPRMALPSRPVLPSPPAFTDAPAALTRDAELSPGASGFVQRAAGALRRQPVLWMVGAPVLASLLVVTALVATSEPAVSAASSTPSASPSAVAAAPPASAPKRGEASELESKAPASLSASELVALAETRSERKLASARELRRKVEASPALAADKALQAELFRFAADAETARDALAAMAKAPGPLAADLLYEVWTGTSERTEATELARAMVYSTDVRPTASPALSVALSLRAAEQCDEVRATLPAALKDGDRRALHLLTKLANKRGCGPKKTADCYPCLREQEQELFATINAVKARRAPAVSGPPAQRK